MELERVENGLRKSQSALDKCMKEISANAEGSTTPKKASTMYMMVPLVRIPESYRSSVRYQQDEAMLADLRQQLTLLTDPNCKEVIKINEQIKSLTQCRQLAEVRKDATLFTFVLVVE